MSTLTTCDECNDDIPDGHENCFPDMTLCNDCAAGYVSCESCGDTVPDVEAVSYSGPRWHASHDGIYCQACTTECDACHEPVPSESLQYLGMYELCESCAETHCVCDDCGTLLDSDWDEYHVTDFGEVCCAACHRDEGELDPYDTGLDHSRCPHCQTNDVHFHLLAERFLCDCQAAEVNAEMVVLAHPLPERYSMPVGCAASFLVAA